MLRTSVRTHSRRRLCLTLHDGRVPSVVRLPILTDSLRYDFTMPQAQPLLLADDLLERINKLVHSGHIGSVSEFEAARLEREIAAIAKDDAATAFVLRGILVSTSGDIEAAISNFDAARKLNAAAVDAAQMDALSNLGYASRALGLARSKMVAGSPDLSMMFPSALASGAAETVERVITDVQAFGQGLAPIANDLILLARDVAAALRSSGHTEDQLAAVLDVAGEVIREYRLLWLDQMPQVLVQSGEEDEDSAPGVHFLYRADISAAEGARLTGEIGWRLVDRDLMFTALTVAVVGMRREVLSA